MKKELEITREKFNKMIDYLLIAEEHLPNDAKERIIGMMTELVGIITLNGMDKPYKVKNEKD